MTAYRLRQSALGLWWRWYDRTARYFGAGMRPGIGQSRVLLQASTGQSYHISYCAAIILSPNW